MENLFGSSQMLAGIQPILDELLAIPNPTAQDLIDIASLQNIVVQLNADIT